MTKLSATLAGLSVGAPSSYLFGHAYGLGGFQAVLGLSVLALFTAGALTAFQEVDDA